MRFKAFLQEGPTSQTVSLDEAFAWIKKNARDMGRIDPCGDMSYYEYGIYKGMQTSIAPHFGDASTFTRQSANTRNYYTLLVDSSDNWEAFPPRSKSWICSTSSDTARGFGNAFVVFPKDNEHIAVCNSSDFWNSFNKTLRPISILSLRTLNSFLAGLGTAANINFSEEDAGVLRRQLDEITLEKLGNMDIKNWDHVRGDLVLMMDENGWDTLTPALDWILDPYRNNIDIITPRSWQPVQDREVWFSGPAMFIPTQNLYTGSTFNNMMKSEFGWA